MMVFGKQPATEVTERGSSATASASARTYHVTVNERKPDDPFLPRENSSANISKLLPIPQDNIPLGILSRYDPTAFNRPLSIVTYEILIFS